MTDDRTTGAAGPRRRRKGYYPGKAGDVAGAAPSEAPTASGVTRAGQESPEMGSPTVAEDGESIAADRVELTRAAVGRVDAGELTLQLGAIGAARADRIKIDRGALGAALAGEVEVERGIARTVLAREVELEQVFARTVIAGEVRARQSLIGFLFARRVEGDVRVVFDWRGALAFGAAVGLVAGLLRRVGRAGSESDGSTPAA